MSGPMIGDGYRQHPGVAELLASSLPRTSTRRDRAFREQVRAVHALGPRPLAEFLMELRERLGCNGWFDERLFRYASISPEAVAALGATDWPKRAAVMVIDGGKR